MGGWRVAHWVAKMDSSLAAVLVATKAGRWDVWDATKAVVWAAK